jgi:hypothetical protein
MKEKTTGDFIGSIVGAIIGLAVVNTAVIWRQWTLGIVLETWGDAVWAMNLSLLVDLFGSLLLAFYRPHRFLAIMRALMAAAGMASIIVFYIVFPVDFTEIPGAWLNKVLRILLIVGMAGSLITICVHLVRFLTGRGGSDRES